MRLLSIFAVSLGGFLLLSALLFQRNEFWWVLLSRSQNDHFYIPLEWQLKKVSAKTLNPGVTLLAGTSRTASGLDPLQLGSNFQNLSLTGSSAEQFLQIVDVAISHGEVSRVILELNPVAFSSQFLKASRQYDYSSILNGEDQWWEKMTVMSYRPLLANIMSDSFEVLDSPRKLNKDKAAYFFSHFEQVRENTQRGFISLQNLPSGPLRDDLYKDCVATTSWALRNADVQDGLKLLEVKAAQWRKKNVQVLAWIPPSHEGFTSADYDRLSSELVQGLSLLKIDVIDLGHSAARNADHFNDCVHLNKIGAQYVTQALEEQLKDK